MSKKAKVNGAKRKSYYFRCDACPRFVLIKEFSVRWKPQKVRRCPDCRGEIRECRGGKETAEAKTHFPRKIKNQRRKHWYRDDYLSGDLWKGIRGRVLERDGGRCVACGKPAQVVHHKSYDKDVLAGYRDDLLVSLCNPCHSAIEFDGKKKLTLRQANERLKAMCESQGVAR